MNNLKQLMQMVGKNIYTIRRQKGLNVDQLSNKTSLTNDVIEGIEHGDVQSTLSDLLDIANALEVEPKEFLRINE
jgi:XRE family transcriptional regulator, regulator of sulfur utilization